MKNPHDKTASVARLRAPGEGGATSAGANDRAGDGAAATAPAAANDSAGEAARGGMVTRRELWNHALWALRRPSLKILVVTVFAMVVLTHQFQELVSQAIWLPQRGPGIFLGYMFFLYAFQLFHKHEGHEGQDGPGAVAGAHGTAGVAGPAKPVRASRKWVKTVQASSLFAAALVCYAGHMYLRYVCLIPVEVPHERLSGAPVLADHARTAAADSPTAADHRAAGAGGAGRGGLATSADYDELIYVPWPMPETLEEAIRLRGELPEVTTFEPNWLREETLKYRRELARTSMMFVMNFILISFFLGAAMTVTYSEAEGVHGLLGKYLH